VSGVAAERVVTVGASAWVGERHPGAVAGLAALDGAGHRLASAVAVDGDAAGLITYADQLRPDVPAMVRSLPAMGVERLMLVSGDAAGVVRTVAQAAGIGDARGDLLPEDKVRAIEELRAGGFVVMMVGDGVNDAPALTAADVGVALAGGGEGITAEAADVVLLADDLGLVPAAVDISRRTIRIARESIVVGLGLSGLAMVFAAAGHIAPAAGALLQEAIDVVVILNALRTATTHGT
ncbi:MAG: HAD-IC family P-type ATPase, partial [Gemmatimonadota bacterium]|nr:HAD-IC family P-type ATPase [Gemmatimonadota bacterium]